MLSLCTQLLVVLLLDLLDAEPVPVAPRGVRYATCIEISAQLIPAPPLAEDLVLGAIVPFLRDFPDRHGIVVPMPVLLLEQIPQSLAAPAATVPSTPGRPLLRGGSMNCNASDSPQPKPSGGPDFVTPLVIALDYIVTPRVC